MFLRPPVILPNPCPDRDDGDIDDHDDDDDDDRDDDDSAAAVTEDETTGAVPAVPVS